MRRMHSPIPIKQSPFCCLSLIIHSLNHLFSFFFQCFVAQVYSIHQPILHHFVHRLHHRLHQPTHTIHTPLTNHPYIPRTPSIHHPHTIHTSSIHHPHINHTPPTHQPYTTHTSTIHHPQPPTHHPYTTRTPSIHHPHTIHTPIHIKNSYRHSN